MKHYILSALLLAGLALAGTAQAQDGVYFTYASLPIDPVTHYVTYTKEVPTTGLTKKQILARAQQWAIHSFLPNARAWQLADPTTNTYSCRGTVHLSYGTNYTMLLVVEAKTDSYTYRINQLYYTYEASSSDALSGTRAEPAEHWASYKKKNLHYVDVRIHEVNSFLPELLGSLHSYITTAK